MGRTASQINLKANTLYSTEPVGLAVIPNVEVRGGVVNVWGAQDKPAAPPTGMSKSDIGTSFSGIESIGVIPNYIYFETVSGTPNIVLTGVDAITPAV